MEIIKYIQTYTNILTFSYMTTFYLVILLLKSHPAVISAGEILLILRERRTF